MKTRKIVLSERRPVTITLEDWPRIAHASRCWGGSGHECQANEAGHITVRQHEDGRTLVYCSRDRGPGGMAAGYRGSEGGYLLAGSGPVDYPAQTHADEIVRAIRRCAGIIDAPELGDECISDLPAEEI
ncbi:MAG: hypothetical protein A2V88_15345 [Elusimicrobia bacterium RBG_16_66_12]|nr:MAG: hypothetical protein A2V88_15345 [Elusimicrobia bacterium RBG_16_66_12]